jgi:hypothetical protein
MAEDEIDRIVNRIVNRKAGTLDHNPHLHGVSPSALRYAGAGL